jgi:hypothetical protein
MQILEVINVTIDGLVQEASNDECLVDPVNSTGMKLGPKREIPGR